jgi:hypothetical protein
MSVRGYRELEAGTASPVRAVWHVTRGGPLHTGGGKGAWSRRITNEHRLVDPVTDKDTVILLAGDL